MLADTRVTRAAAPLARRSRPRASLPAPSAPPPSLASPACASFSAAAAAAVMGALAKNPPAGKVNGGLRNVDELLAEKARATRPRCATWQRSSRRAIWAPRSAVLRRRARDTHAPVGPRGARQAVHVSGIRGAIDAEPLGCTRNWRRPACSARHCTRLQRSARPQRCTAPLPARRTARSFATPRVQRWKRAADVPRATASGWRHCGAAHRSGRVASGDLGRHLAAALRAELRGRCATWCVAREQWHPVHEWA